MFVYSGGVTPFFALIIVATVTILFLIHVYHAYTTHTKIDANDDFYLELFLGPVPFAMMLFICVWMSCFLSKKSRQEQTNLSMTDPLLEKV